jgi:hypothetical protein
MAADEESIFVAGSGIGVNVKPGIRVDAKSRSRTFRLRQFDIYLQTLDRVCTMHRSLPR